MRWDAKLQLRRPETSTQNLKDLLDLSCAVSENRAFGYSSFNLCFAA
jgi:hypothetical protein